MFLDYNDDADCDADEARLSNYLFLFSKDNRSKDKYLLVKQFMYILNLGWKSEVVQLSTLHLQNSNKVTLNDTINGSL